MYNSFKDFEMKREIEFRGLSVECNVFIYGYLVYNPGTGIFCIAHSSGWVPTYNNPDEGESNVYEEIKSETIGEYTGIKDKNGKKIFEGDILKLKYPMFGQSDIEIIVKIIYDQAAFWFEGMGYTGNCWHFYNDYEVIGNIYETPELLNENHNQRII